MLYFAKARGILVLFSTHLTWFIEVASLRNLRQVYHSNDSTIFFLLSKRPFRTIIICWRRRQKCAWRIGRNNPWYSSSVRRSWDCQLMSCGPTVHRSIGRSLGRRRPKLCASIADEWWTTGGPATERWVLYGRRRLKTAKEAPAATVGCGWVGCGSVDALSYFAYCGMVYGVERKEEEEKDGEGRIKKRGT